MNQGFSYTAAIVDHLSLFQPNQNFVQTATTILEDAGFNVTYYPGKEVTVEFYRNLPTHGYGLIILRVHSALGGENKPPVALLTSEAYSTSKYVQEQLTNQLTSVVFASQEQQKYFGIFPNFVSSSMNGRFENTIVILMGCYGLTYNHMAKAFTEKGAKVFISWNERVLSSHTDQATTDLLQNLVTEKQTIKQAVTETMNEVGPDPEYGSILLSYPGSADNYVIPNSSSNLILKEATVPSYDFKPSLSHAHCP